MKRRTFFTGILAFFSALFPALALSNRKPRFSTKGKLILMRLDSIIDNKFYGDWEWVYVEGYDYFVIPVPGRIKKPIREMSDADRLKDMESLEKFAAELGFPKNDEIGFSRDYQGLSPT